MAYDSDLLGKLHTFTSSPDSVASLMAITHAIIIADTGDQIANENIALQ